MAGQDDKRRRDLLDTARTRGVKVPRGASAEEIDEAIQSEFDADYGAISRVRVTTRRADQQGS